MDRPNILLITTDQHHFRAMGTSTPLLRTPNLDRLSREGTRFDRAYCPSPFCTPSRSSIVTGQYPSTHQAWTLGTKLDETRCTLGNLLTSAGYGTSLIGKAHFQPLSSTPDQTSLESVPTLHDLEFWRNFHGPYYGFDHVELARNHGDEGWVGQHYALWMEQKGLTDWRSYFRGPDNASDGREFGWDLPAEFHYTTFVGERSAAEIERLSADSPFFLWASFHDPHPPYLVPEPWASMYAPEDVEPGRLADGELDLMPSWFQLTQEEDPDFGPWQETPYANHGFHSHLVPEDRLRRNIATYYGMISFVDAEVGRILASLDEQGLAENTLVVFTTDHGHFLGQHGLTAKGPFHYEDLVRIPFVVRHPGRVPAGVVSTALQSLVDLMPTFLTAAGVPVPLDVQGVDQLPTWDGTAERARDHVIVENRHQPTLVHVRTLVQDRYKITVHRGGRDGELFDLHEDPDERRNLFHDPGSRELRAALVADFLDADLERERSRYPRIAEA